MNEAQRQRYRGNEAALAWRAEVGTSGGDDRAASIARGTNGIAAWIVPEAAAAWAVGGAFEWVALGYLATSSVLIAGFWEHLSHPAKLFCLQAPAAVMILVL